MKIFSEKKIIERSWALKLAYEDDDIDGGCGFVDVDAVDSVTGKRIATINFFANSGHLQLVKFAETALKEAGYDPFEHNNIFDELGRMIIIKE